MYNDKVLAHFKDPHNVGTLDSPDGFALVAFALLIIALVLCFMVFGSEAPQQPKEPDRDAAEEISDQTAPPPAAPGNL